MADISQVKLPDGTTYNLKDSYVRTNYRALSNNDFDTINVTELNGGDAIFTGAVRFTNKVFGDNNTTYSLSASGESVVLSGSDNSSSTANLSTAFANYTPYKGNLTSLGSASPASAMKTYWDNNDNIKTNSVNTAYNTAGQEYAFLLSKGGSNQYGAVIRWGYGTKYFEILRKYGSTWKDDDWVKMDAGYADTAGSATKDGSGNTITSTYLPLSGGTMTGQITLASTGLKTDNAAGYTVDNTGNFRHQRSTTSDYWNIQNNAGSAKVSVYWESGNIISAGNVTATKFIGLLDEENLRWGGTNAVGQVSPVGMCLSSEHSANRLAYINGDALSFEYSSDGGSTWTDCGYTKDNKTAFCTLSYSVPVGRASASTACTTDSRTRFTITGQDGTNSYLYTNPKKLLINISSACGMKVLIEYRTGTNYLNDGAWSTFGEYTVSGWSGWNDIPLVLGSLGGGTTQTGNNWQLRLTFIVTSVSASYSTHASVLAVRLYGENAWFTPSTLAATGHLYTYNISKDAFFPASVSATKFIGTATNLSGFTNTTTTATAVNDATQNGHVYVSGTSDIYGISDGAAFVQAYSANYVAQIYQDYRTGQIALRGKNNGTWQAWRKVWDSVNLTSKTAAASGTDLSLVTTGEKATWNAKGSGTITSVKTTAGAHTTINVTSGAANFNVPTKTSHLTNDSGFVTQDTKNTAGSTDTSSKIFLIGATSQAANPQTYSDNEVYTTSGVLTTKSVQVGGGSATMEYSATTKSINFVFAS